MQQNIVNTFMQRTESLSLSPLIMWTDQCILDWREREGLMMKERIHKAHPPEIQMSLGFKLYFYRPNIWLAPFRIGFLTNTIEERNGIEFFYFFIFLWYQCSRQMLQKMSMN